MPLAGKQLSIDWALALAYHVGWRGKNLTMAVAIMTAESGRYVEAYHENSNGSTDRGLFQINSIHDAYISPQQAYKPIPNAAYAFKLSKGGEDWNPWYVYKNGTYKKYYAIILARKVLRTWRKFIPKVPLEL